LTRKPSTKTAAKEASLPVPKRQNQTAQRRRFPFDFQLSTINFF
jgi:hypothetical protein